MKRGEQGFSHIEILVAMVIVALLTGVAMLSTFQVINVTRSTNDHMTAVRQVQNAGYWISRDALMAKNVIVDLESADFLILTWTEWGYDEDSIYHTVTYSFPDLPSESGKLMRTHWSSAGANEETMVAEYISSALDATYETTVLTVQITASFGEASETKEYTVWRRPEF